MVDPAKLIPGCIVWANLPNSQGKPCKDHRFIVISSPVGADSRLPVVGISTDPPTYEMGAHCVKLRWSPIAGGHVKTKLKKECWAHCHWLQITTVAKIHDLSSGHIGDAELLQIRKIIAANY